MRLEIRAELPPGATLLDSVPRPRAALPEGFRILSHRPLSRLDARTLAGGLRVAFYRTGTRTVPPLTVAYRRAPGAAIDTLVTASMTIEIVPVLPAGEQSLRDIKDLEPLPGPSRWLLWAALALALAIATYLARRLLRRRPRPPERAAVASILPRDPYEAALERLAAVERATWPERGRIARHYEELAEVLRRCLSEAEGIPAPELTTAELLWTLPPDLAEGGLRELCRDLLEDCDLVKFARVRPTPADAAAALSLARGLLVGWRAAARERRAEDAEHVDALR